MINWYVTKEIQDIKLICLSFPCEARHLASYLINLCFFKRVICNDECIKLHWIYFEFWYPLSHYFFSYPFHWWIVEIYIFLQSIPIYYLEHFIILRDECTWTGKIVETSPSCWNVSSSFQAIYCIENMRG